MMSDKIHFFAEFILFKLSSINSVSFGLILNLVVANSNIFGSGLINIFQKQLYL